jgi:hypothetical protein
MLKLEDGFMLTGLVTLVTKKVTWLDPACNDLRSLVLATTCKVDPPLSTEQDRLGKRFVLTP